jgi:hypothetical protein
MQKRTHGSSVSIPRLEGKAYFVYSPSESQLSIKWSLSLAYPIFVSKPEVYEGPYRMTTYATIQVQRAAVNSLRIL